MTNPHYDITVADFLEFEFCFEVAAYLNNRAKTVDRLYDYKILHPENTKGAAHHILMHMPYLYAVVPKAHVGSE